MKTKKQSINPVDKLVKLLKQTIKIATENINGTDNFDLVDFSQTLENYVDELTEIENFETYNDEFEI